MRTKLLHAFLISALIVSTASAADWPQWRGLNRDGKVSDFKAPSSWPKELTKKWSVPVGDGAATPALVGDKLFVFTRGDEGEILRCLDAASGKEIWKSSYAAEPTNDPGRFFGPRSSPAVAEGKVVTQGARGILSCFDAADGKMLWQKDDFKSWPRFYVASSPLIVNGLCIAQLGGEGGAVVAYDLTTGAEKWRVADLPTAYASPVLMTVAGTKLVIAVVSDGIVAIDVASGNKVWEKFFDRGGSNYKSTTPVVSGDTLIYFNAAASAVKLEKDGEKFVDKPLWTHMENRVEFNTPVLQNGLLIGLTGPSGSGAHQFFCLDIATNKATWTSPAPRLPADLVAAGRGGGGDKGGFGPKGPGDKGGPGEKGPGDKGAGDKGGGDKGAGDKGAGDKGAGGRGGGKGGEKGGFGFKGPPGSKGFGDKSGFGDKGGFGFKGPPGGKGGGGGLRADTGYGSVVAAGPVILTLTPNGELIVFEPAGKELKQVTSYKLGEPGTYAYPVVSDNRIFIKDKDTVALWTLD